MRFEEALKLMREGKKVWLNKGRGKPQHYFYLENNLSNSVLMCHDLLMVDSGFLPKMDSFDILSDKWEEYKKPILDNEEKKYLEDVLRPFRNRANTITIRKHCNFDREYIELSILSLKWVLQESMFFPSFEEGTMYKGMETNRAYKLEELGLFEEEEDK